MAWIKMRTDLRDAPQVAMTADELGITDAAAIGAYFILWAYADTHSTNGKLGVTPTRVDRLVGIPLFSDAATKAGWLGTDSDGLCFIPRFSSHNGQTAKKRCSDAKRKEKTRGKPSASCPLPGVTKNGQGPDLEQEQEQEQAKETEINPKQASKPEGDSSAAGTSLAARPPVFEVAQIMRRIWPRNTDKAHRIASHPNATLARTCWLADRILREKVARPAGFMEKAITNGWDVPPEWVARFEAANGNGRMRIGVGA